jgi:hypothetical protein
MRFSLHFFSFLFVFALVHSVVEDAHAASPSCASKFDELNYVADFDWVIPGQTTRKMKIRIGALQPYRHAEPILVAHLISKGSCEATCRTQIFEKDGEAPLALEMRCQSSKFDALTVPVTLFWPAALGKRSAVLRFGTWLEGYRQAPLFVQLDRWSGTDVKSQKKLAQFR